MERYWINSPSILQPLHAYHGLNVIGPTRLDKLVTVYPVNGSTKSMLIPSLYLANGWNKSK